jgi:hypothetical protein
MAGVILLSLPENPSKKTTPQFDYILLNSMTRADGMSFLFFVFSQKQRHVMLNSARQRNLHSAYSQSPSTSIIILTTIVTSAYGLSA